MISTVKQFFEKYIKSPSQSSDKVSEHALQIATAALLIELMRSDTQVSEEEQKTVKNTIRSKFQLTKDEISSLLHLAEEKIWEATGYFEFTSLMNKGFTYDQKVKVIEHLWEVAFADGILDKHEEHMVRRIASLIHVSHKDFIEAKLRVKAKTPKLS
ncbi:MAG: TerB family tellurite resistance protein [Nitrospiraceae bacterium]|nr:MAG: TerB family tellurite resistance protein [Nitrospiraceae bacterium]